MEGVGDPLPISDLPIDPQALLIGGLRCRIVALRVGQVSQIVARSGDAPSVSQLLEDRHALLDAVSGYRDVVLHSGHAAHHVQRLRPQKRRLRGPLLRQGSSAPCPSLTQIPAHPPELL